MAVEHKRPVAMFSLEMSSIQLVNRLIVAETELPSDRIRNGRLEQYEWEQLEYRIKGLIEAPIYIDDTPAISIYEIRAKCRRLKNLYDIQVIIIDYLQLMSGPGDARGNREQEVSTISRALKGIAKELNVPIIALSQLNRSVELRSGTKRPQLSDLRESGAIEQDADIVCFIHRPEKYGLDVDDDGNSTKGIAEIIVAKHRNGPIGNLVLRFREEFAKFTELDDISPVFEEEPGKPAVTFGSKMNEDFKKGRDNTFDVGQNSGFEDQPF
jgi:replicative DNA helicase